MDTATDPVLIAATRLPCPATLALGIEGVPFIAHEVADDLDYGHFLAENWKGEVVICEHDVVPWPGAIDAMRGCHSAWCVYRYHFGPGIRGRGWALGCLRVHPDLVAANPDLPAAWQGVVWNQLDAAVVKALIEASGQSVPHEHDPPLAHVKGEIR